MFSRRDFTSVRSRDPQLSASTALPLPAPTASIYERDMIVALQRSGRCSCSAGGHSSCNAGGGAVPSGALFPSLFLRPRPAFSAPTAGMNERDMIVAELVAACRTSKAVLRTGIAPPGATPSRGPLHVVRRLVAEPEGTGRGASLHLIRRKGGYVLNQVLFWFSTKKRLREEIIRKQRKNIAFITVQPDREMVFLMTYWPDARRRTSSRLVERVFSFGRPDGPIPNTV